MLTTASVNSALKSCIISDAGNRLDDDAITRAVNAALHDYSHDVPYYKQAEITLEYGVTEYPAPDDAVDYASSTWGTKREQYFKGDVFLRPKISLEMNADNQSFIVFDSLEDEIINRFGKTFKYKYLSRHFINDTGSSIHNDSLFLTRAQAELMRELMSMNVVEPIQASRGMSDVDLTGTPQYIYRQLMADYKERLG